MNNIRSLDDFLSRNNVSKETWEKANIAWETLAAIAADHESQRAQLEESAAFFAKLIQKYSHVHSVRWRVKDTEHLLEKIIRKRAENNAKYAEIDTRNYFEIITDLVGVRVLHLFKEDCLEIDQYLTSQWTPHEKPVAFVRAGDRTEIKKDFSERGFEIKEHPAGYRSVHYVFCSQPIKRKVITEVQVRTIFEEGWSEIDHTVRYPNFSDNELVEYFLTIFNRLAGSADEMGAFVRQLANNLAHLESELSKAKDENASILQEMEKNIQELEAAKSQDKHSQEHIAKLRAEVEKLKKSVQAGAPVLQLHNEQSNIPAYLRRSTTGSKTLAELAAAQAAGAFTLTNQNNFDYVKAAVVDPQTIGQMVAAQAAGLNIPSGRKLIDSLVESQTISIGLPESAGITSVGFQNKHKPD